MSELLRQYVLIFFFSSRRRHTRFDCDWSSDVCSSDLCSHQGRTAPCADAVIAAGVARVVAAMNDPNPQVAGAGFRRMHEAGVEIEMEIGRAACRGRGEISGGGGSLKKKKNRV